MLTDFFTTHPEIAAAAVAVLALIVGYGEERILRRTDIACMTWFFGVLVATVGIIGWESLGTPRWVLGMCFFIIGIAYLFWHYKKSGFRSSR